MKWRLSETEAAMNVKFNLPNALSGLVSTGIPFIFKGMINEWLTEREITVKVASQWVIDGKDLLILFKEFGGQDFENALQRAGAMVKDSSWLTSEWLIDACREEHPAIASLFLGWEEGRVWLDLQTENLRDAFNQVNPPAPVQEIQVPQTNIEKTPPRTSNVPTASIQGVEKNPTGEILTHLV